MAYCSQTDILAYTGFTRTDFLIDGSEMSLAEWADFLDLIIDDASQIVNRYCNVIEFTSHAVTEYHNGRGATGDNDTYLDSDKVFTLRELPVITVSALARNVGSAEAIPAWETLSAVSESAAGDYLLETRYELTHIRIVSGNVPRNGYNNVRVTYTAGYSSTSNEMKDIRLATIRIAQNLLLQKKKIQEATSIRASGIRDYSQMFSLFNESFVLTDEIKTVLDRYRRKQFAFDLYQ